MTRRAEWATILAGSFLAAFGVTLVNFADGRGMDVQSAITFMVFLISFGGISLATHTWASKATPLLLPIVVGITTVGFIQVYSLSAERAGMQRWWLLIGATMAALLIWALSGREITLFRRYRYSILAVSFALLLLPNLPSEWPFPLKGVEMNGSRLWVSLDLRFTTVGFQPAELAKLGLVIFLAAYLADHMKALREAHRQIGPFRFPEPRQLVPLLVAWGISLFILVSQRDLGASLLLFAGFILLMYAATGASGYLVAGAAMTLFGGFAAYTLFSHVRRRVVAWLDPFGHYLDEGYQIVQGLFALGSGSLAGAGPGMGRPDLIPHASTDFVFAAVGEELGLAGTVASLAMYGLVVTVGLGIAFRSRDTFRKLLAAGLTFIFAVQVFLIVGGILRIVPLTGITLPFMSYGGSALVGNLLLVALLLRISHEEAT